MKLVIRYSVAMAFIFSLCSLNLSAQPTGSMALTVRPFLEKNCVMCHNSGLPSGSVDLQTIMTAEDTLANNRTTWTTVVSQLQSGLMPPEGQPKPAKADLDAVVMVLNRDMITAPPTPKPLSVPDRPATKEWLTFSYDPERTGWARGETELTKATVGQLKLLWKTQTDAVPSTINLYSTMTDPVVAENVQTNQGVKRLVFTASAENNVYAIDADTGTIVWERKFPNTMKPLIAASGNCPNNLNATPVIDKDSGTIYFLPNDGKLRGVSISNGEDKFVATSFVPPYTRNFSLNLVEGWIYTGTTRGCGGMPSEMVAMNLNDAGHPVTHFYLSPGKGSGPWGTRAAS